MKKIFLVEDNPDNRDLVCAFLEEGYEVESFASGPEVLDHLRCRPRDVPTVMLLDIALPGMDGVELLGRLRTVDGLGRVPAIALTAHAMKGDDRRFMDAGFDGYVSKPIVDDDDLTQAIEALV